MAYTAAWQKLGRVYDPSQRTRSMDLLTHASNPVAVHLDGNIFRVYYSARDAQNRSSVGAFDLDVINQRVVAEQTESLLKYGPTGSFYSHGISLGCACRTAEGLFMYFMGWHCQPGQHWQGKIGRAEILDDGALKMQEQEPLLNLSGEDAVSLSYPWVLPCPQGGYRMIYGSTISWDAGNGDMLHILKEARSSDARQWQRGVGQIPYELGIAQAFSRPSVLPLYNNILGLWYSYRGGEGGSYRIGYAEYRRQAWELCLHQRGLAPSESGWDSEMVEYPFVFQHKAEVYMLYNGNGYGRTGIGLAKLV